MAFRLTLIALIIAAGFVDARAAEPPSPPRTFCNPLDLDYGWRGKGKGPHRHGADPVVVLYKDRYYLFSTWDKPGYRVSDDLVNWKYIPFAKEMDNHGKWYTAAATAVIGDALYYFELSRTPTGLYRTTDPDSGRWERVGDIGPYADPHLFVDPKSNRLFVTHGLDRPARIVELDSKTFKEIPGTDTQLMPAVDRNHIRDGWEICTWDNNPLSPGMRGNKTFLPCREGTWLTLHDGTYFLQYASPGTTVPGYADGALTADNPLGPYTSSPHSPISRKASGFITSAGHSCLFQDRHGNWWRAVTMLVGVHERFERRIGLFPAGFDPDNVPYTRTELGDTPITVPTGKRDHLADVYAGWWPLSAGATATASSTLDDDHAPTKASDEDVRTWWSAKSGDAGEFLQLDLGAAHDIRAIQVNLVEQDAKLPKDDPTASTLPSSQVTAAAPVVPDDYHRFTVATSEDGTTWTTIVDRSKNQTATPHAYVHFDAPVRARHLKVTNVHTPAGGNFAVSDLRAFGITTGPKPSPVADLKADRDPTDRRKVTLTWPPAKDATAYLVRYGITQDKLYQHDLVRGGATATLTLHNLNADPPYMFRVDSLNSAGRTEGPTLAPAP